MSVFFCFCNRIFGLKKNRNKKENNIEPIKSLSDIIQKILVTFKRKKCLFFLFIDFMNLLISRHILRTFSSKNFSS